MQQFSWIPPKYEIKFTLCNKKSLVISDFAVTFLPVSGPPTCQERPKYSVLLMKRICSSSRSPGFLTLGLTSSPGLLMFRDTFGKTLSCLLVFLKTLFSPGLVSPVKSLPPPNTGSYTFPRIWNIPQVPLYLTVTICSLLVSSFPIFAPPPASHFLSCSLSNSGLPSAPISLS